MKFICTLGISLHANQNLTKFKTKWFTVKNENTASFGDLVDHLSKGFYEMCISSLETGLRPNPFCVECLKAIQ